MPAEQSLRDGRLDDALAELQDQVRREPANPRYRLFLFQLLAVLGQWPRARQQLQTLGQLDPSTFMLVQTYQATLTSEALRAAVFAGQHTPLLIGEPTPWLALLTEALRLAAAGQYPEANSLREQAFAAAPAIAGTLTTADAENQPFAWLADADSRLGPVLEVIVNGHYGWVPFQHLRRLQLEPPSDLRDLVWLPAQFTWSNGGTAVGFIPSRYPGTEATADHALHLARRTEWQTPAPDLYFGLGQRLLTTDAGDIPLFEVRQITLTGPADG